MKKALSFFPVPTRIAVLSTLILLLGVLYFFYSFGFGGIFFFDDPPALDGLLYVNDWPSALFYLSSGSGGPLGRPVALASFFIDASDYPESAAGFLMTNTVIHLLNVLLVALILQRLQRQCREILPDTPWFAPLTAGLWGILPILASTSMMVVQRMTSLSALFVLLGVWIYLWGRSRQERMRPVLITVFGIGACTLLALLSKENGALLPVFLLIMETTLLPANKEPASVWPRRILRTAIVAPSLGLAIYMLSLLPGSVTAHVTRPFSLSERLLTEPVILWDYLRMSFLPRLFALGPFHDDYPVYRASNLAPWFALVAWLSALGGALAYRRAYPVIAFGLLWYLGGHFIESTWIPLELYFEHRNYLPILGPVIAVSCLFSQAPLKATLKTGIAGIYFAFLAFVLWQTTSIWGNRELELWARQHPASPRAVQTMAQSYVYAGRSNEALSILDNALSLNSALSSVAMQSLRLQCYSNDAKAFKRRLSSMLATLETSHFSHLALFSLDKIRELHERGACPLIQSADLHALADKLLSNEKFYRRAPARAALLQFKAKLFTREGQYNAAIDHLQRAFAVHPDQEVLVLLHSRLIQSGRDREATELLRLAVDNAPSKNPIIRQQWLAVIEQTASMQSGEPGENRPPMPLNFPSM